MYNIAGRIKVFFVTHLHKFAHGLHAQELAAVHFLRAGRQDDGERTYKLCAGAPLQTSFGDDLYKQIFG